MVGYESKIKGKWHFWEAVGLLVSNEDTKELKSFSDIDSCINYLYLTGDADAKALAVELNEESKSRKKGK